MSTLTTKPKVAVFESIDWENEIFRQELEGFDVQFFSEEIEENRDTSDLKEFEVLSGFIYSRFNRKVLEQLPKVRLITTRSTGFDHIDLEYCKERGITVCNVPTYGENTVAEHTFALILCLSRNVHEAWLRTIRGDFSMQGLMGFDLKDKVLGVVGTGHIGLRVIKIAKGFGMNVIAYDVKKNPFMSEFLGFKYVGLDELLQKSDIISLHAPYNKHTHHLINQGNISLIKKGALLINTARGGLVETPALIKALDDGILAGAGLDVLEGEDLIKEERQLLSTNYPVDNLKMLLSNHILLRRDNVIITPHIGFNSREAIMRILMTTASNIRAFYQNAPENVVGG